MTELDAYLLHPIGVVRSEIHNREDAPKQGFEGAPDAWLEIYPAFMDALKGITPNSEVIVLTWFHQASRDVLKVHPRRETLCVSLAEDFKKLQSLREHLRDRMTYSPLCDAKRFTTNLEMCYRKIWETCCKST